MNKANGPMDRIKMGLGIALMAALMGCVGYMGEDYGGAVVVPDPDLYLFGGGYVGGGYERGRDVRVYSHRGSESRASAHPATSSAAHSGGGGARGGRR